MTKLRYVQAKFHYRLHRKFDWFEGRKNIQSCAVQQCPLIVPSHQKLFYKLIRYSGLRNMVLPWSRSLSVFVLDKFSSCDASNDAFSSWSSLRSSALDFPEPSSRFERLPSWTPEGVPGLPEEGGDEDVIRPSSSEGLPVATVAAIVKTPSGYFWLNNIHTKSIFIEDWLSLLVFLETQ